MATDENKDKTSNFNYAAPGAHVGIQCQAITIGSVRAGRDDAVINDADTDTSTDKD